MGSECLLPAKKDEGPLSKRANSCGHEGGDGFDNKTTRIERGWYSSEKHREYNDRGVRLAHRIGG
jgi:hypothetical protein